MIHCAFLLFFMNYSDNCFVKTNNQLSFISKGLQLGWGVSCKKCPEVDSEEYKILCPESPGKDNDGSDINECTMIPGICAHGACENLDPGYRLVFCVLSIT